MKSKLERTDIKMMGWIAWAIAKRPVSLMASVEWLPKSL